MPLSWTNAHYRHIPGNRIQGHCSSELFLPQGINLELVWLLLVHSVKDIIVSAHASGLLSVFLKDQDKDL